MKRLALVLGLLVLCSTAPAAAGEDDAAARAAAVRAKLPAPGPTDGLHYEGDIVIDGIWAGTVSVEASPRKVFGKPVWRVVEKQFHDYKGIEVHLTLRYHLTPDLALRGGASEFNREGTKVSTVFTPTADGYQFVRTTPKAGEKPRTESLSYKGADKPMYGVAAAILFARALPADDTQTYDFAWFPLADVARGSEPEEKMRRMRLMPSPVNQQDKRVWRFQLESARPTMIFELSADRRTLRGAAIAPPGKTSWVPKGTAGKRIKLDEEQPAKTWQQAFLKFGYGYHMARKKLLEEAFDWDSMYEYETKVTKSWTGPADLEKFRDAWVGEFLRQSLHRSRKDTERLLNMTLASGKIVEQTEDKVVFAAHKNFGGGTQRTYTLIRVKGTWFIAHVKF